LNAINREFGLFEEPPAHLFQVHGASADGDLASCLDHSSRWSCTTSERDHQGRKSSDAAKFQGALSFAPSKK
jgi:hypothetical protein